MYLHFSDTLPTFPVVCTNAELKAVEATILLGPKDFLWSIPT